MKIPARTEMKVLLADSEIEPVGWFCQETIGIAVVNTWMFKPWYKKIWHSRFWLDLFRKFFYKRHKTETHYT